MTDSPQVFLSVYFAPFTIFPSQFEISVNSLKFLSSHPSAQSVHQDGVKAEASALIQRDAPPSPRDFIRDPYILEFLDGQPQSSWYEKDVEQGLLDQLQKFLLELGKGFAFVARQRHLRIEGEDAFVDLVFYNYILKCFVLIELKVGKLSHQDVGQLRWWLGVDVIQR